MAKPNKDLSEWIDVLDVSELMSITLGELIETSAKKFPDTEALVYSNQPEVEDIRWTYKDLDEMSSNPENSKILTIDETKYRVITGVGNAKYISDTYVSMSVITNDDQPIVYANYDGFPIRTGDKIITTWTMVQRI